MAADPPVSSHTFARLAEQAPELAGVLRAYTRRWRRLRLAYGGALTLCVALLPLPIFCALDRFLLLGAGTRYAFWLTYGLAVTVTWSAWVLRVWLIRPTPLDAAFAIGDRLPGLHQRLAAAVQFRARPPEAATGISSALLEEVHKEAGTAAGAVPLADLLPARRARRACAVAGAAILLQAVLLALPGAQYALLLARFFFPMGNWPRASGVELRVTPGSGDAGDGESVAVEAEVSDERIERLGLYRGVEGAEPQRFEMQRVRPGLFRFILPNLRQDVPYFLAQDLIRTQDFLIRVMRRPRLEEFVLRYRYPDFTGLPAREERLGAGNFRAPEGTEVELAVHVDTAVSRVVLRKQASEDAEEDLEMSVQGQEACLAFKLEQTFRYQVVAFSRGLNLENRDRMTFTAEAQTDRAPEVRLFEPAALERLDAAASLRVRFEARDEFSVQAVRLVLRKAGGAAILRNLSAEGLGGARAWGEGLVSLAELGARPGDAWQCAVQARDRKGQWGESPAAQLEIPLASGDPDALRRAERLAPLRQALAEASRDLAAACAAIERLSGLLAKRPSKWNLDLENATQALRPAVERVQQNASRVAGIAVQSEAAEAEELEFLEPLRRLAVAFDGALKQIELEGALVDIRQDFKAAGPSGAKEILRQLQAWREPAATSALAALAQERWLRLRDQEARATQLTAATQGLLVEGFAGSAPEEALRVRARMAAEESEALVRLAEETGCLPPADGNLVPKELFVASRADAGRWRQEMDRGGALDLTAIAQFLPGLTRLEAHLQRATARYEGARAQAFEKFLATRTGQDDIPAQLWVFAEGLRALAGELAEDPVDKVDELELLPPRLAELRRYLEAASRYAGELWVRADEGFAAAPRARLDLVLTAWSLGQLERDRIHSLRESARRIVATFAVQDEATPLLKDLRPRLDEVVKGLADLQSHAEALAADERMERTCTRLGEALRRLEDPSGAARRQAAAQAVASELKALAQALSKQDRELARILGVAVETLTAGRRGIEARSLLGAWALLRQASDRGAVPARGPRAALLPGPQRRGVGLRELASRFEAVAQGSEAGPDGLRAALDSARAAMALLVEELAVRAAEAAAAVPQADAGRMRTEILRARATFLQLWRCHREGAIPAAGFLELAEVVSDMDEKQALGREAARPARLAAQHLKTWAARLEDSESASLPFPPDAGLEPIGAEQAQRAWEEWRLSERAALAAQEWLRAGEGEVAGNLDPLLAELAAALRAPLDGAREPGLAQAVGGLEQALQILGALASRQHVFGERLGGTQASERAILVAYRKLAADLAVRLPALARELAEVRSAAERFGPEVAGTFAREAQAAQRAAGLAAAFAQDPSQAKGRELSKALDMPPLPLGDMAALVARLRERAAHRDAETAAALKAWPAWEAFSAKLRRLIGRYNEQEALSMQRHEEFKRRLEPTLAAAASFYADFMKLTGQEPDAPNPATDRRLGQTCAFVHLGRLMTSPNYRNFTNQGKTGGHGVPLDLAGLWSAHLRSLDREMDTLSKLEQAGPKEKAPGLFSKIPRMREAWTAHRAKILETVAWYRPEYERWVRVREEFATELERLEQDLNPLRTALQDAARQLGDTPASALPEIPAQGKNGTTAPRAPTMANAALALDEIDADMRRTRLYALLGGAHDPNVDARKAEEIQKAVPPQGALTRAGTLADAAESGLYLLRVGMGGEEAAQAAHPATLAGQLHGAVLALQGRIADGQILSQQWARWRQVRAQLEELRAEYDRITAEREAAYDAILEAVRPAYKLVFPHLDLYCKYAPLTAKEQRDGGEISIDQRKALLTSFGSYSFPQSWFRLTANQQVLEPGARRTWVYHRNHGQWPFASYWHKDVGDHLLYLAELAEGFAKQAAGRAPADVPALKAMREDLLKAAAMIQEKAQAARPHQDNWKDVRHAFAPRLAKLREALAPVVKALALRAHAYGEKLESPPPAQRPRAGTQAPALKPTVPHAAHLALKLASELEGVAVYDLLGGEGDPNVNLKNALEKQETVPPAGALDYAADLARAGNLLLEALDRDLAGDAEGQRARLAQMEKDLLALATAASGLQELREREPALRSAVEAVVEGNRRLGEDFLRAQQQAPQALAAARGQLQCVADLDAEGASAPWASAVREVAAALSEAATGASFVQASQAFQAGDALKAAEALKRGEAILRAWIARLRVAVEELRAEPASAASSGAGTPDDPRSLYRDLLLLRARLREDPRGAPACAGALVGAQEALRRRALGRIGAIGAEWMRETGAQALEALVAARARLLGVEGGAPPVAGAKILGQLSLRPAGRDPRGSDYGRLSSTLLRDLDSSAWERTPAEAREAWLHYVKALIESEPPKAPEPAKGSQP